MAPASAKTLVASRTIRSRSIITAADVILQEKNILGALTSPGQAIGLEARVVLYAGRPIRPKDVGHAAIIERNQVVTLVYQTHFMHISVAARSLGRAGIGDTLRVMNLSSRTTVSGRVGPDGSVTVGN